MPECFVPISKLELTPRITNTSRREVKQLDMLCEEMCIPWREVNSIAEEVVGHKVNDSRYLSVHEIRDVVEYLKSNRSRLFEKYRRMRWR